MKILGATIAGFGRLTQHQSEFHPQFNVVFGPNEAGKTTLLHSLLALLYGFYDGARASQQEKKFHDHFRPWQGTDFGGSLRYELDDGTALVVHRDFIDSDIPTQLLDAVTGEDVARQYSRGRHGRIDFIERQLGMPRAVFLATACIRHGVLRSLESREAGGVSDAILRLLDSAATETSADLALERLDKCLRELSSNRSAKALLTKSRQRQEELHQSRALRQATQKEIQHDYEKIGLLELELEELAAQSKALECQMLEVRLQLLKGRLSRWHECELLRKKYDEEIVQLASFESFPTGDREEFFQLRDEFTHDERLRGVLADERNRIEISLLGLDEKSRTLNLDEQIWEERSFEDFLALCQRWNATFGTIIDAENSRFDSDRKLKDAGFDSADAEVLESLQWEELESLKQQSAKLKATEKRVTDIRKEYADFKSRTHYGRRVLTFATVIVVAILISVLVSLTKGEGSFATYLLLALGIGGGVALISTNARWANQDQQLGKNLVDMEYEFVEERQKLRSRLSQYKVTSVENLIERRAQYVELGTAERSQVRHASELDKVEAALQPWLGLVGAGQIAPDTVQIVETRLRESHQLWSEKAALRVRLKEIGQQQQSLADQQSKLSTRLQEILQAAGIVEPVGEIAFQAFINGCQKREYLETLRSQLQQSESRSQEVLEGESLEELTARIRKLETQLAAAPLPTAQYLARVPDVSEAGLAALQEERDKTVEQLHQSREELSVTKERIATRLQDLPPLAELEEEIAIVEAEITRLENAREALTLARETIAQAAQRLHRDFVPHLNDALGRYLKILTLQKYSEAFVNPADFSVKVKSPESAAPIDIERLSFGTREQIYLLLRAVVVEMFSTAGESVPMFMDDPLVHADVHRVTNALEVLDAMASSHQLFYFTKDQRIATHARERYGTNAVIELS